MIGMLNGRVESVESDAALIDVNGVGYEVRMPATELSALHCGQEAKVFTSLNVSQDAIALYGFLSQSSKRMFLQLQKVSGIGPRVALSLLSTLPPEKLAKTVMDGDAAALAKAPGLGKKARRKSSLNFAARLISMRSKADTPRTSLTMTTARCRSSKDLFPWAGAKTTRCMPSPRFARTWHQDTSCCI